nr:ATP-binding protein [Stagnihabitans tardus]
MTRLAVVSGALLVGLLALLACLVHVSRKTRRSATEAAATASRLDAVISASLDPVVTLDAAGRITGFSPAGAQLFGHSPESVLGRDLGVLIPASAEGPQVRLDPQGGPQRLRVTARQASGRSFPAEASVSAIRTEAGAMFVVFLSDRSAQVAAEQALTEARDTALAGEKAKADLLVLMSHELRTPLNGMLGTVELLQATEMGPQQRDYLRIMADSGRLLMNYVNDILDMTRLDSGRDGLTLAPVDLERLVQDVVENQRPASALLGNDLAFERAPDCPTHVMGDQGRLRQILLNLVGNAVKFTRAGQILIRLQRLADGAFQISVTDTGIGIAKEDLDRVFEDFVTLDPSFARRTSGTGLGLGIVRRIVTRMGGTVSVESEPGRGSTFRLVLPLEPTNPPAEAPAAPLAPAPCPLLRILVVEDNFFNRLIVREMLKQDGHAVTEASDGLEGLRLASEQDFDVILMDISMPELDGIAATQRLRAEGGRNAATPVLALTAHAMPDDLRRFRAVGMRHVLFKPVERAVLREALAQSVPPSALGDLRDGRTASDMSGALPPEVLAQLTDRFITEMELGLTRLADAPLEIAVKEAHHMAGSAGVFGAKAMGEGLERLLTRLRAGEAEAARAALPGLTRIWAQTVAAYRQSSRDQASSLR